MESEESHTFENDEQFWQALDEVVGRQCNTHSLIDDALRSYLTLTANFRQDHVQTDDDLRRCAYKLYSSSLFAQHTDYIRTQFVHSLLQEDEVNIINITTTFLLADARQNEQMFELLNNEGVFARLVQLISSPRKEGSEDVHRLLMELLYEMARIQRITNDDLICVDDHVICSLFDIIEEVSYDVNDPYHYPVIRVLLVLNEQFMVAAHDPTALKANTVPLTNKVIKVLSSQGNKYKTFSENIILLLNREDETSLQLLTLKLLYLLFTTPLTYEYFYTNDLHVLVDILIRNLLDLPEEAAALRHTYLRVLYPLLEHTQLHKPPHYKREELRRLLSVLVGEKLSRDDQSGSFCHFEDVDDTTKRLVRRCQTVSWLVQSATEIPQVESPTEDLSEISVPSDSPTKSQPPAVPTSRKLRKRNNSSKSSNLSVGPYLTPQLDSARQSSLSMMEMAAQKEKPGVITPSRNPSLKHGLRAVVMQKKDRPPPPPQARRSAWMRRERPQDATGSDPTDNLDEQGASKVKSDVLDDGTSGQNESIQNDEKEKLPKRPPPAPKTRRWRLNRTKSEEPTAAVEASRPLEPGKFTTNLPSIETSSPFEVAAFEESPFSPPAEKTLTTPSFLFTSDGSHDNPSTHISPRVSSVSAALHEAQAQAVHDIETTLEKVNIRSPSSAVEATVATPEEKSTVIPREGSENFDGENSPTLLSQRRAVLAPPSQAPIRGVPGPTMLLERSPFLSDNEESARTTDESLPSHTHIRDGSGGSKLSSDDDDDDDDNSNDNNNVNNMNGDEDDENLEDTNDSTQKIKSKAKEDGENSSSEEEWEEWG